MKSDSTIELHVYSKTIAHLLVEFLIGVYIYMTLEIYAMG